MQCLKETLPTLDLTKNELKLTMDGIDLPDKVTQDDISLDRSQLEMIEKIKQNVNEGFFIDYNTDDDITLNDCQYYTTELFSKQKFDSNRHSSIMHLNIHSIAAHITELRVILTQLVDFQFDFVCITESKIKSGVTPIVDISIDGYQPPVGMPTDASKGGVLIYIKEGIDFMPREDLNMHKSKELESYFVEVINKKGKNDIIGTVYRHPCMDPGEFIDHYVKPLNDQLSSENKRIFVAGDFNLDLLNTSHEKTLDYSKR